jgi:protease I
MKPVLLVIAHEDFQPVECITPKKVLLAAGLEVKIASDLSGEAVAAMTREKVMVDVTLDEVNVGDYDGIFFMGGPGALKFLNNEKTYKIIREAAKVCKAWGAICISPRILAAAGVLGGRRVTGWDGDNGLARILSDAGAEYVGGPVVADGSLITADGPAAAEEFGKRIVELLI